ncbi:MAG: hypothetical protein JXR46_12180 [Calditrichaceae bacterium]|nr:hypothetical protein [Calditrichaceae bacterium]MBN2709794.1 hypothetical protein [Calditrichaceae bacterium]RQV94988.1 MAG: hypothetical protein EH224_08930 [Calditrichota bacterium]
MIKLKFRQSALTFESSAFQINYKIEEIINRQIFLDFRSVTFIDPFSMLFLKYLLDTLSKKNFVKITFDSPDVINYLIRMSFNNHFTYNQNLVFNPDLNHIQIRKKDLSDRLIELTNYTINNDDDVEQITLHIIEIVSSKIQYYDEISDVFQTAISETISNIQVHSTKNIACVCLQTYGNSVIIALGDDGIGIKASLKNEAINLNDEDAIDKALKPLVSGRPDGGGMGLTELVEKIKNRNDCLGIRSGSGYIFLENGIIRKGKCAGLPGTQLMIKLSKC